MKYLFTAMRNGTDPSANYGEEVKQASAWIKSREQSGIIEAVYGFLPDGGFSIANYDSHEAAWADLISYPLYGYSSWEVTPIIGIHKMFDKILSSMS